MPIELPLFYATHDGQARRIESRACRLIAYADFVPPSRQGLTLRSIESFLSRLQLWSSVRIHK